jgi:fatty-acyl-CoA synthase
VETMPDSRTLGALTAELAERFPDNEAVVAEDGRLTYAELHSRVRAVAKGLLACGVGPDDKVASWLPNQVDWVVINLAVTSIGGVLVGLNTWYRSQELHHVLTHAGVKVLIMRQQLGRVDFAQILQSVAPELAETRPGAALSSATAPDLRLVFTVDDVPGAGMSTMDELIARGQQVSDESVDEAMASVAPEDPADLLYTSGSTALPKGVVLLHGDLIENGFHIGARLHVVAGDRLWFGNPLFFSYGCANALMVALSHAATIVLQQTFDAGGALAMIAREKCTVLYGTTNMILAMVAHPDRQQHDLSSLRTGTGSGTPAHMRARMELGVKTICNGYGLTEAYGHFCDSDADDSLEVRLSACGRPLPGNEARITNPQTGEPVPIGTPGEIRIRGRVMPGYYKAPELNAAAFDADGFFRTGDLGWLDEDGQVHFQSRLGEMIKTGGLNVAPLEVELVLSEHPAVDAVCVVGLPDDERGEIVAAMLAAKPGMHLDAAEMTAYCRERIASYKVPRRFEITTIAQIPLTPTGKVWRKQVKEQLLTTEGG